MTAKRIMKDFTLKRMNVEQIYPVRMEFPMKFNTLKPIHLVWNIASVLALGALFLSSGPLHPGNARRCLP